MRTASLTVICCVLSTLVLALAAATPLKIEAEKISVLTKASPLARAVKYISPDLFSSVAPSILIPALVLAFISDKPTPTLNPLKVSISTLSIALTSVKVSILNTPRLALLPLTVILVFLPILTTASKGLLDVPISVLLFSTDTTTPPAEPVFRFAFLFPPNSSLTKRFTAATTRLSAVMLLLAPILTLVLLVIVLSTTAPVPAAKATA